jgi:tetratricopeptide (TPR) repeat protein
MSDLDLSKLVSLRPQRSSTSSTSPGSSARSASPASPATDADALDRARKKIDGQITEYTEATGEGIDDVEAMYAADPSNPDLMDWLAFLYYTNNRLDEAIGLYRKLLSVGHKPESQYFYLGNAYFRKGLRSLSIEQWKRCVEVAPASSMARKAQARIEETQE